MKSRSARTLKSSRIRVALTMGDPSGIGAAIAARAINAVCPVCRTGREAADFTIIGDRWAFEQAAVLNKSKAIGARFIDLKNVPRKNFSFGKVKKEYGRASIEYLEKAMELIKNKEIDCLVTCPISKEAINLAGCRFPGHTEYLAEKTAVKDFVMLLLSRELKIALVTGHIPLSAVPGAITEDSIYKTILLTFESLKRFFLIKRPRMVVCGLNPHASDNGLIGSQDIRIIKPAVQKASLKLKYVFGPLSSDWAILKTRQKEFDCAVAMYHDQALIPLKLCGWKNGVNMTLGLPFVRTSPLHGTAFDIAGKGKADPSSLIEAIRLAVKCTRNLRKN